jgi:hypothetical protein
MSGGANYDGYVTLHIVPFTHSSRCISVPSNILIKDSATLSSSNDNALPPHRDITRRDEAAARGQQSDSWGQEQGETDCHSARQAAFIHRLSLLLFPATLYAVCPVERGLFQGTRPL